MKIREANANDAAAIARIILPTIRAGATYALDSAMTEAEALACWLAPDKETFVAEEGGVVLGTCYLRRGFAIAGTLPDAFRHPDDGVVDAFAMYRKL